ncbi:MAG: hypothetical protein ACLQG5_04545 [Methanobacterium sp.]|jgi:Ca2+/Na+ antiporter
MKNKFFFISILIVFIIIGLMIATKILTFPFSFIATNNTVSIDIIVVLDVLIFFTLVQLQGSTSKWLKSKETDTEGEVSNPTGILLTGVIVTLAFNLLAFTYFVLSNKSLELSFLQILFNTFVLLYIIYLIFVVGNFINRRNQKMKKSK